MRLALELVDSVAKEAELGPLSGTRVGRLPDAQSPTKTAACGDLSSPEPVLQPSAPPLHADGCFLRQACPAQ